MAKKRKFAAYRALERPYTRFSKYRKKNYIRARPNCRIVRYHMGATNKEFSHVVRLCAKSGLQIRDNAIESSRLVANRLLEKVLGKANFYFKIAIYPHHVLRENPLASGAGADRMSTGMKMSFGKVVGLAAQIKPGQEIFRVYVDEVNLPTARKAFRRSYSKLPCSCSVIVEEVPKAEVKKEKVAEAPKEEKVEKVAEKATA